MFANFPQTRNQRRGVVLILVLGMLGLLALIGVTFATFSGQVKVNARNFSQAQNWPDSSELMDYALSQLIDDTDNPQSAIRGHSLKRDMYGNDGLYNSALTYNLATGQKLVITNAVPVPVATAPPTLVTTTDIDGTSHSIAVDGLIRLVSNITPQDAPAYYGYNFTRWILRFPPVVDTSLTPNAYYVGETYEILADVIDPLVGRIFYVAPDENSKWAFTHTMPTQTVNLESMASYTGATYSQAPTIPYPLPSFFTPLASFYQPSVTDHPIQYYNFYNYDYSTNTATTAPGQSKLVGIEWRVNNSPSFELDGRFLHAFNGPGMSGLDPILPTAITDPATQLALQNRGMGQYGNFRVNGNILNGNIPADPNYFNTLAAYGSPSICGMDEDYDACDLENWFLAMQSGDGQLMIPSFHRPGILISDTSVPRPLTTDPLTYYDDWTSGNTFSKAKFLRPRRADGHSSIAFPDLRPDANGKIEYDVDNDGDGSTDSVWLDLGYPARRNTDGRLFKPLFAFMIIGLNGRIPLNTAGNLQLRTLLDPNGKFGWPMGAHASGKGYSPSEIDPTYALDNAFEEGVAGRYSPLDNAGSTTGGAGTWNGTVYTAGDNTGAQTYSQWWGTAGVPVKLTQLRNILAGTRLQSFTTAGVPDNKDANFVMVDGSPMYLPNGVQDFGDAVAPATTTTAPIAGRWGEPGDQPFGLTEVPTPTTIPQTTVDWPLAPPTYRYENQVRAGISGQWTGTPPLPRYGDARDDNHTSFDWYPSNLATATVPVGTTNLTLISTLGENADFFDASGSLVLPVERLRRFLTPIDVMGDGFVNSMSAPFVITPNTVTPLLGADKQGRVAYVKHFRPPGLALATPPGLPLPAAPLEQTKPALATRPIWYPFESNSYWLGGIGYPAPPINRTTNPFVPSDMTTNLFHGFESYRNPKLPGAPLIPPNMVGAMPSNNVPLNPPPPTTAMPNWTPTYDQFINTKNDPLNPVTDYLQFASLNEADEMSLYNPQPYDQPFGPSDLEWLYRQQDTDGISLSSRLKDLAPVSFTNKKDGQRRRRLFSIESWEPTNFVWANDNPANNTEWPLVTALNAPYGNSLFYADALKSGGPALSRQSPTLSNLSYLLSEARKPYNLDPAGTNLNYTEPRRLPSVAHRDRKINLNFPLPVSNRYDEPVRQKWIRETYQLLKLILPPKAVDTPEELAQLSQYVTNIIDFRDPDCTSTRFVNTDIYYSVAATPTAPAQLDFAPPGGVGDTRLGPPWNVPNTLAPPPYSELYDVKNSPYVVQYGMEYNPVAITEVLAYQMDYQGTDGTTVANQPRMWVELVNTLTESNTTPGDACNLSLHGWDFVILPDDPSGRPDPFTGQLPRTSLLAPPPVRGVTTSNVALGLIGGTDPGGLPAAEPIRAMNPNPRPYLIQNAVLNAGGEVKGGGAGSALTANATIDLVGNSDMTDPSIPKFYWLYLRRPANPFDTSYDPSRPNENRVVVDCFRFMYSKSRGVGGSEGTAGDLYSLKRLQPFRGGHAVLPIPAVVGAPELLRAYVRLHRADDARSAGDLRGKYGAANSTGNIYNDLGTVGFGTAIDDYAWEQMPFNDRDFTSVAELLMVPGCPPGLFTKQFVELSPTFPFDVASPPRPTPNPPGDLTAAPILPTVFTSPTTAPTALIAGSPPTAPTSSQPRTFPYLVDKFFYTAQSEPSQFMTLPGDTPVPGVWPDPSAGPAPLRPAPSNYNPTFPITKVNTALFTYPNYIGGPSSAGWFRMFEFFDVPTPANGSIGPVAQGTNYDWARQDLKPGLLNINLIIDEEVFFAVMSESWLKTLGFIRNPAVPYSPAQEDVDNMGATRLNVQQIGDANTPIVVSQVNANGSPNSSYSMINQGFLALDPVRSELPASTAPVFSNKMKAAFSDFLKLRHGGSGYMFAHQTGKTGDPNPGPTTPTTYLASERPYHSLSYPDINLTVMRPAALPPSDSTFYKPWLPSWTRYLNKVDQNNNPGAPFPTYVGDPGLKNPYLFTQNNPVQPPPLPPRRLFELPDVWGSTTLALGFPAATGLPFLPANTSRWPTTYPLLGPNTFTGDPVVNWLNTNDKLTTNLCDLSAIPAVVTQLLTGVAPRFVFTPNFYLGANTTTGGGAVSDNRQHPAFRYDWLHKVTNLTTVRTHQYAVWITVGFFEVTKQGDPTVGSVSPDIAFDWLGQELNVQSGKNVRYRSFFVIDRTRAVGFSPQAPGNFRECIVYRQPIE